jgi:hypothetical protein
MVAACPPLCLHCEQRPPINAFGLCAACHAVTGIRRLYVHRRGWTPEWEAHLRRLTERARLRLPLFDNQHLPGDPPCAP